MNGTDSAPEAHVLKATDPASTTHELSSGAPPVSPPSRPRTVAFAAVIGGAAILAVATVLVSAAYGLGNMPASQAAALGLGILAATVGVAWLLVVLPKRQARQVGETTLERFNAENEARKTLAQIVGGVGLVAGLFLTTVQLRVTQNAAITQQEVTRDGQRADRFIRAVQQLGDGQTANLSVRIGAIYTLEQIARESKEYHWPIVELLAAYVREHSPSHVAPPTITYANAAPYVDVAGRKYLVLGAFDTRIQMQIQGLVEQTGQLAEVESMVLNKSDLQFVSSHGNWRVFSKILEDVAAALRVLGRRDVNKFEQGETTRISLSNTNLNGADLRGVHFEGVDLSNADLSHVKLGGACLTRANLSSTLQFFTSLESADLRQASLQLATLMPAADYKGADLRFADVRRVSSYHQPSMSAWDFLEPADRAGVIDTAPSIALSESELLKFRSRPLPQAKPGHEACVAHAAGQPE